MGKKTFWSGIVLGAVVGGAVSMFNKDARKYVKNVSEQAADQVSYYMDHPNEAVSNVKRTISIVSEKINSNSSGAMNTLNQVENTLNKVLKK